MREAYQIYDRESQDARRATHRLLIAFPEQFHQPLPHAGWAATKPVTEYDLMMRALTRARNVDRKAAALGANSIHPTYRRTDAEQIRRADRLTPVSAAPAGRPRSRPRARLKPRRAAIWRGASLPASPDASTCHPRAAAVLCYPDRHPERKRGDLIDTGRDGPTVVVIGDSFTRGFWKDYFSLYAGKFVWIHHEECGFFVSVVEAYHPDIVILAPVERQMFCAGNG